MIKLYISIISHGHEELLINNPELIVLANIDFIELIIKDNKSNFRLKSYCESNRIHYISTIKEDGFGKNNNIVFDYAVDAGLSDLDWFLIVNPDVIIDEVQITKLMSILLNTQEKFFTINLFQNDEMNLFDNSVRRFPSIKNIFKIFSSSQFTEHYDKHLLPDFSSVEWASGAFLVIKPSLYRQVGGFDEKYFMYFEDVDLCYRIYKETGFNLLFLKDVHAVHKGAFRNRNIFSRHFLWYISSMFRFLSKRIFSSITRG